MNSNIYPLPPCTKILLSNSNVNFKNFKFKEGAKSSGFSDQEYFRQKIFSVSFLDSYFGDYLGFWQSEDEQGAKKGP